MSWKDPDYVKEYHRKYYQKNKEEIKKRSRHWSEQNREKNLENKKKYYEKNKEQMLESMKEYREKNRELIRERDNIRYQGGGKEKRREYNKQPDVKKRKKEYGRKWYREKYQNDIQFKLAARLRVRLYEAINRNFKSGSAVDDLGCTIQELKVYLENQFQEGMTWDNWTTDGWHIDHKKPLSKFNLTDREQFLKACHYTNLQPLWWYVNLSKSDKLNYGGV